jgi:hypothetical protein
MFSVGDEVKVVDFPKLNGETGIITKIIEEDWHDGEDEVFFYVGIPMAPAQLFSPFPFMFDEIELVTTKEPDWEV